MRDRFLGCLLGGAVGDALGAPVEFMARTEILTRFGPDGLTDLLLNRSGQAEITDDTQMTLFTAEGLLRAHVRGAMRGITTHVGVTAHAYLRWLATQGEANAGSVVVDTTGLLFQQRALHQRRAPGLTCLSALRAMRRFGDPARNDSKGCGGVMRMAPVGLFLHRLQLMSDAHERAFDLGAQLAGLTHGHPTGQLTAGVLADLILSLTEAIPLPQAITAAKERLRRFPGHAESVRAIEQAETLAASDLPPFQAIARLGEGWVAEEALAIALYCALVAPGLVQGVILAVNHDGDSDSTGAIAGNLLGVIHGVQAIPPAWLAALELSQVIREIANDLFDFRDWKIGYGWDEAGWRRIVQKYPGV